MPTLAAWRAVVGLALLGATVAAAAAQCGVLRMPGPAAAPGPTSGADAALSPDRRCFGPGASKAVLTTADGLHLAAALLGGGPRALVLVHHANKDMCQWAKFARHWASDGYRVIAFDLRCHGYSECGGSGGWAADVTAAVAAARAGGARRVALVGGGLGATVALVTAARLGHGVPAAVAGVVALSAEDLSAVVAGGGGPRTATEAAGQFWPPVLMVNTASDAAAAPAKSVDAFLARAPSPAKERIVRPGTAHGCDLLNTGGDLPDLVDRFLAEHTR